MRRLLAAMLTATALSLASTATASADVPPTRCWPVWTKYETKYVCPLWRGAVSVFSAGRGDSPIVGRLDNGGNANWFSYQCYGRLHRYGPYYNHWWAYTLADHNGRWGFVSEVYFAGGDNDERAVGIRTSASRCWGS